jgi:glutathione S-transferase
MITLFQFPPYWGIANASVFCMKLEVFLKMTEIPYTTKHIRDPRRAPQGKLPFIKDVDHVVADSTEIIHYLNKKYTKDLNAHLSKEQIAQALAVQRMLEEHTYWITSIARWIDDKNWPATRDVFFGAKRSFHVSIIANIVRKRMRSTLQAHGIGRHPLPIIYQRGVADLQALAALFQGPYMFGEKVSEVDAIVYAVLANVLVPPTSSPLKDYILSQRKFVDYCTLMKQQYC